MGRHLPGLGSRLFDGIADTDVGHATAQVAGHDGVDVMIGRGRKVTEQRYRLHDLTGLAITALGHLKVGPRLLHWMPALGIEALDGRNLRAAEAAHGRYAGARGSAPDMNRAGAAHPNAAADLRSGEADDVADHPQQRRVALGVDRHRAAIDMK